MASGRRKRMQPLGVNGQTIRSILTHGDRVLKAARKQRNNRVSECRAVAYLLQRPAGSTSSGHSHPGSWGFLLLDIDAFMRWEPSSPRPPPVVATLGRLIVEGKGTEPELPPAPPGRQSPRQRDRWKELQDQFRRGWVPLQDFVQKFDMVGRGEPKFAAHRAAKRLRESDCDLKDSAQGVGRPVKMARIIDLKRCYSSVHPRW